MTWALLLQREKGEDDRVEGVNWGRRTTNPSNGCVETTAARFDLSKLNMSPSQSEPVSQFLEASKKAAGDEVALETLYFNDAKALVVSKGADGETKVEDNVRRPLGMSTNP